MENLLNFDDFTLNEKMKSFKGLTKKKKSEIVKKARHGEYILRNFVKPQSRFNNMSTYIGKRCKNFKKNIGRHNFLKKYKNTI